MFKSLRSKVMAGYLLLVAVTLAVGGWAVYTFFRLDRAVETITVSSYRSIVAAQGMQTALNEQNNGQLLWLLGELERGDHLFTTNRAQFVTWLQQAESNITYPPEAPILGQLRTQYDRYLELHDRLRVLGNGEARRFYESESYSQFVQLRTLVQNLMQVNQEALEVANVSARFTVRQGAVSTLWVAGAGVLGGVLLGLNVTAAIVRPIKRLTDLVRQIGEGYRGEIPVESADETGQLAAEFNRLTTQIKEYEASNLGKLLTERRRAEAMVHSITDGIVLTDADYRLVLANPAAERLLDISESRDAGRHILQATGCRPLLDLLQWVREGPDGEEPPESVLTFGDRYCQVEPVPVEGGGLVVLLRDVTQFKELDRLKTEFISQVSHELRTPLTSIAMGVGLLQEGAELTGRSAEMLEMVEEETTRLTRLVGDLLDLSRLESGRMEIYPVPLALEPLLEQVAQAHRAHAEELGIKLETEVPAGLPPALMDGARVSQVLHNLVSNALRYTPRGGRVALGVREAGGRLQVTVTDNGVGIPREFHERIFEKFAQVPGATPGQAGLGLAIAREIVEAHGGRIWVESQPGQGARFTFTLKSAMNEPTGGIS